MFFNLEIDFKNTYIYYEIWLSLIQGATFIQEAMFIILFSFSKGCVYSWTSRAQYINCQFMATVRTLAFIDFRPALDVHVLFKGLHSFRTLEYILQLLHFQEKIYRRPRTMDYGQKQKRIVFCSQNHLIINCTLLVLIDFCPVQSEFLTWSFVK